MAERQVSPRDVRSNYQRAVDWSLSTEQMDRLNQGSDKPLPYPYNYLKNA